MIWAKIDETRLTSAILVIENHLDGAVPDYENGDVENVEFLEDLAYVHEVLEYASTHGWSNLHKDEYVERIKKAKEKLNNGKI